LISLDVDLYNVYLLVYAYIARIKLLVTNEVWKIAV